MRSTPPNRCKIVNCLRSLDNCTQSMARLRRKRMKLFPRPVNLSRKEAR
ncbi:hypothetical protein BOS5A_231317 [Bosea sp. EC-HK365B]|nr:hypothetical protein BOS5A_231317 [Bosea sp. EC-HK365B]